jgi:hypothetical protein
MIADAIFLTDCHRFVLALAISDLDGSTLTPANVNNRIGEEEIAYHVWVAVKRVIAENR